jgi:DNA replication protein DnaC
MECQHPNCSEPGDYPLIVNKDGEKRRLFFCLSHHQEAKRLRASSSDVSVEDRIESLFGEKFRDATFSTFRTDPEYFRRIAQKIREAKGGSGPAVTEEDIATIQDAKSSLQRFTETMQREREGTVFLFGPNGLGKTHLLAAATRKLIGAGLSASSWHMTSLVTRVWATYSEPHDQEIGTVQQIIEAMKEPDVLILQDINEMCFSNDIREYIFEIVDSVYRNRGILMMSANLTPEELMDPERLGTPAVTRILEPPSCVKKMTGPSHRQARKAYEKTSESGA